MLSGLLLVVSISLIPVVVLLIAQLMEGIDKRIERNGREHA